VFRSSERYALCAGAPVALRQAKASLVADHVGRILLVSASREGDLVNYENEGSSFMFNFGSGACAMVLEEAPETTLVTGRESAVITDGNFSEDVVMPAGGSRNRAMSSASSPSEPATRGRRRC
jgi:3-oxoacyl-[acyl-carrier-protein] synthase-3